jgi:branched-chain amino acid aminotransferase
MERKVYLNGQMVAESEAKVSVHDIGFMYGATFFESVRTFKHKLFKLEEHLSRLERSMRYVGLEPLISKPEMAGVIEKVLAANIHLTEEGDDCWICAEVTPGVGFPHPLRGQKDKRPTVIAYSSSLPYDEYVRYYTVGKHALTPSIRNIPPQSLDLRSKNRSRLHYFIAKIETMKRDSDAFSLLLDLEGNVTEGSGANFFIVANNTLYTPSTRNILVGISRQTVLELAKELNLPAEETDINLYDVYNADEAFWATTSYCILPISQVNHLKIGKKIPGPWTGRLLTAWSKKVGIDILRQAQTFAGKREKK